MKPWKYNLCIIICIIIVLVCIFAYFNFTSLTSVDVDCLLDIAEDANITDLSNSYGQGIIDSSWTLEQVENFYWFKHPKTRWAAKFAINYYLNECEK